MKRTNRIIAAAEAEERLGATSSPEAEDVDLGFLGDEITVEDLEDTVARMSEDRRQRLGANRKQGRAIHREQPVHQTRERQVRREPVRDRGDDWRPADTLFAPPPQAGYEQRWIRVRLTDRDDPRNFDRKFREGWSPRKLSSVPGEYSPPTISFGRFQDVVAVSDLILCERPAEIGVKRRKYFQRIQQRHMDSADRRHVDRVQRADHVISGGARVDGKPTVGRGYRNRQAPVQED